MKIPLKTLLFTAALTLLLLSACSLAEDITPPPGYQPDASTAAAPVAAQASIPLVPPDPGAGAAIYTQKCLACHGASGKGDGPQAAKLPARPPSIGSEELARASRPVDWYDMVTQGNLQKFMPGFSKSLTDRQRWDVVAYVYTLSTTKQELMAAQALYQQQCQNCHGLRGKGDGSQAGGLASAVKDWTDPSQLAQRSGQDLHDVILNGYMGMPAYQGSIDDSQAWALVSYARALSYASSGELASNPTPPPSQAAGTASTTAQAPTAASTPAGTALVAASGTTAINGQVINASGGDLPSGTKVNLLGYDQMNQALSLTTDLQPDGTFRFENVETNPNRIFLATIDFNGNTYNSDILNAVDIPQGQAGMLTVHIYETTTDASALTADRMHVFFDFSKPGIVQVAELFIISNPTTRMVVAEKPGTPIIKFALPQGASNLSFQDGTLGGRYVQTADGFGDTQSIAPGSGAYQVLFAYQLPYQRGLDVAITPPLPVQAAVIIAPSGGVKLQSSQLTDGGVKDMSGVNVHLYTASALAAGTALKINLSGVPGSGNGLLQGNLTGLIIGLAALLLAILVIVFWFLRQRQVALPAAADLPAAAQNESVESTLDAIVALDDLYQSGQIPQEAYNQRRAELKERLRIAHDGGLSDTADGS